MTSGKILNKKSPKEKRTLLFPVFFVIAFCPHSLPGQVFNPASGPAVETPSDSRSVNFIDLNNDGWEDLYISNGRKGGQQDLLYINDGSGNLKEAGPMDALEVSNPSDGASFADIDNDGDIDGVISSWYGAEDLLYLNDGKGNLYYHAGAGIAEGSFAETAAFGDYDQDGLIDLYITNSGKTKSNFLYRNTGNGRFERITDHILVKDLKLSRGAVWGDVNNDGLIDLFVANEENAPNDLFFGRGGGDFEKLTEGSIVTSAMSSMTGSWGDIDNDGDLDLFVGNAGYFTEQRNQLFRNTGDGFEEIMDDPVTQAMGCTFGSAFGDYDNDGDLDLVISNGFCKSGLENVLYENQGDGTFRESTGLSPFNGEVCSYGIAWGDINNDGFLDLAIANCMNTPSDTEPANTVLLNQGNGNNWLKVKLRGTRSNSSAIGARVAISATIGGRTVRQIREVQAQSGYAGQNSLTVHFGLKDAGRVEVLQVIWPSGEEQSMEAVQANQLLVIEE